MLSDLVDERLYSKNQILQAITRLADSIDEQYKYKVGVRDPLVFVTVLKGAIPFYVYLSERLTIPNAVEFISVKTFDEYSAERLPNSPVIDIPVEVLANLVNRHVIILDDICDSGETLRSVKDFIADNGHTKSVKTVTLFYNDKGPNAARNLDYLVLPTHGNYIYGFGLDSTRGIGRNLRDVYVLKDKV